VTSAADPQEDEMLTKKNFGSPDETRPFQGKGQVKVIALGDAMIGLGTFEPGWRWSENIKPIAGGESCQANHTGYVISGRMGIKMNDGQEIEVGPGDTFVATPGHDAWVVGGEKCVVLDWTGIAKYAKKD
jgi:quercetin dioxygenase-like cupin family protein